MAFPSNIVYRFEGRHMDVVIVKDNLGLDYCVAYQYSKAMDSWRFHLTRDGYRYETINYKNAKALARRLWIQNNEWDKE